MFMSTLDIPNALCGIGDDRKGKERFRGYGDAIHGDVKSLSSTNFSSCGYLCKAPAPTNPSDAGSHPQQINHSTTTWRQVRFVIIEDGLS